MSLHANEAMLSFVSGAVGLRHASRFASCRDSLWSGGDASHLRRKDNHIRTTNIAWACDLQPDGKGKPQRTAQSHQNSELSANSLQNSSPTTSLSGETALLLAAVPALWGSYGIATKIFMSQLPWVPPTVLNVAGYAAAAAALKAFELIRGFPRRARNEQMQSVDDSSTSRLALYIAAAELGLYLFLGSWAQLIGLSYTSATRSAIFVQLTTVLVPVSDIIFLNAELRPRTLVSAFVAFVGVSILGYDPGLLASHGTSDARIALNIGDWLSILSALLYTAHVIRLDRVRGPTVLKLVGTKTVVQLALGLTVATLSVRGSGLRILTEKILSASIFNLTVGFLCVMWIGIFTTALATAAQVEGQRRIGPSLSAVIYSCQPLFAAVMAFIVLGDRITLSEVVGGALVVTAGILVTSERNT